MRLVAIALLAWTKLASAAGDPEPVGTDLALDWQASPNCSSDVEVRNDVATIVSRADGEARKISARVRAVEGADGRWHVDLITEADGDSHKRSFDAESCSAVESAVVVILAFAINPQSVPAVHGDGPLSAAAAAIENVPTQKPPLKALDVSAVAKRAPVAAIASAPTAHLAAVSGALAFDLGTLPDVTEGVELALGCKPGRWWVELVGANWSARTGTAPGSTSGARFQLLSAAARAGYVWPLGRLGVGPVLHAELAKLNASEPKGTANDQPQPPSQLLAGIGAGGSLAWRIGGRVELHFLLEGVHWLERPYFVVKEQKPTQDEPVYRPGPVVLRATLGASVRFF